MIWEFCTKRCCRFCEIITIADLEQILNEAKANAELGKCEAELHFTYKKNKLRIIQLIIED